MESNELKKKNIQTSREEIDYGSVNLRKVAVIGLGVSNLPLLDYLHDKKANVTIFDDRTIDELPKETIDKITNYGFEFSFGKSSLEKLNNFDLIFRSPSCLPTKPELEKEAQKGVIKGRHTLFG